MFILYSAAARTIRRYHDNQFVCFHKTRKRYPHPSPSGALRRILGESFLNRLPPLYAKTTRPALVYRSFFPGASAYFLTCIKIL